MKTFAALFFVALLYSPSAHAQVAPAQPAPPMPEWGTILGRVVYAGKGQFPAPRIVQIPPGPGGRPAQIDDESFVINKQNSGLANVVLFLRSKPSKLHPGYADSLPQKQILRSRNFRLEPHVSAIWTKDFLELRNEEKNVGVNVKCDSPVNDFNVLITPGETVKKQFKSGENLPKPLSDNIHFWKHGQLLVRDNPYFCVTDERGIFCIPNLPTGEVLEFVFWHERCGYMGGMMNQAPNPMHNTVLNKQGRLYIRLTEPVLDLGEFLADPQKLK